MTETIHKKFEKDEFKRNEISLVNNNTIEVRLVLSSICKGRTVYADVELNTTDTFSHIPYFDKQLDIKRESKASYKLSEELEENTLLPTKYLCDDLIVLNKTAYLLDISDGGLPGNDKFQRLMKTKKILQDMQFKNNHIPHIEEITNYILILCIMSARLKTINHTNFGKVSQSNFGIKKFRKNQPYRKLIGYNVPDTDTRSEEYINIAIGDWIQLSEYPANLDRS